MKIRFLIYPLFASLLFLGACADYLDKKPDDMKTMDMVWESRKETESYLYSIYSQLPKEGNFWENTPWIGASDEADITWERYLTASMNVGNWNPTSDYYNQWPEYYKGIRATFVFENNVDRCYELTEALNQQYRAEVKFLRGFYYWLLLRQYGPFVLLEEETDLNDDWNIYARTPYDECVDYICRMLDEAEEGLPWNWKSNTVWLGKPDKMACKAVKSEVLLMAASPQWNGNKDYSTFRNQDGTPLVNTDYQEDKWKVAAAAAKAVIDAAENNPALDVKLYKNTDNGDATFNPYKSVRDVHLVKWNSEVLWAITDADTEAIEKHATPVPGGWGGLNVTQRQVDAFFMHDGRTIEDPQGPYVEEGFATTAHPNWYEDKIEHVRTGDAWGHRTGEWNMYANREARFYASVLYNGRPIPQVSAADRERFSSSQNRDGWGRVEFYKTGVSGSSNSDHSTTGYLIHKYVHPEGNPVQNQYGAWRQFTYIRLAKIYLNYIEALNEYDPGHADIKKYWDLIRERAGLESIFTTYPEIRGDKAKQLEYIIRERQVELCFESDRYFTTRRRWIAHTTDTSRPEEKRMFGDGGPMYGMNITEGDGFNSTEFYIRKPFETRVFDKKMSLFPIRQEEINNNKAMVQNPGW